MKSKPVRDKEAAREVIDTIDVSSGIYESI
jgi:hypothetical protein